MAIKMEPFAKLGTSYRQTAIPSSYVASFDGDDTDDHDYIALAAGKAGFTAVIKNLSDQAVTVQVWSSDLVTSDIGDGGVVQLTTFTVGAVGEESLVVRNTAPFHIFRLTQAVAGDGATISVTVQRLSNAVDLSVRCINVLLPAADMNSAAVEAALPPFSRWTLYTQGTATDVIMVELSPDGGANWYEIEESPFTIGADNFSTTALGYVATRIRLTNETGTDPTAAQVIGVL